MTDNNLYKKSAHMYELFNSLSRQMGGHTNNTYLSRIQLSFS